ncbi:fasciclin domain-containing protein [Neolewinella lacunae]|uniref:Fasciclin domain-containing protein n=1 Tax=Neolewinella lacunae TaxID=1517758 RepID=A0A923PFF9_9BACT|nr:fasciclin domain-containing protein [Neolewinella lacunae]MBC6993105.1 fasciclin domain-containing protein [Neolewinella lacunae]MDN3635925.1 fasciclin domain-containing protein [Neolewinella lacunae]
MFRKPFFYLFVCITFLGISACDDDDDNVIPTTEQTIAQIVAGDAQFSILLEALELADLDATLAGTGPFTVFAPTNAAFTAAGINLSTISQADLREVLLYHVIGGAALQSTDLAEGQTYATTAATTGPGNAQLSVLVERTGNNVTVNGNSNVTQANIVANNGVIHVVNTVLTPLDIVGHAQANSNFTSLVGALGAADGGLVSVLQGDGPFTVFAPLNSAFTAIQSTVDGLTTEQLSKVLLYHVVSGANVRSSTLAVGPVTTANAGTTFQVNSISPPQITDASGNQIDIVLTDVQATNGVIHVVSEVLVPNNL